LRRGVLGCSNLQTEKEAQPPPLWQLLVTDGHVQAARIRAVQPWLTSTGIGLILLGALLQFLTPAPILRSRDELLHQQFEAIYSPAISAVAGLARVHFIPSDSKKLTSVDELPQVVGFVEDSLNHGGQVTHKRLILSQVDPQSFWHRPWPLFRLISTGNRDLKLVGAIVNVADPDHLDPYRWLGVFRKHNGRWQYVSLAGNTFYAPPPAAQLRDIAIDLSPLLPQER
jgi:hypothetical protein